MIIILSSAKTLKEIKSKTQDGTKPIFEKETNQIVEKLKKKSLVEIKEILNTNNKIAQLNLERFQNFHKIKKKLAIFNYNGLVFKQLDREKYNQNQINFTQKHILILSGIYGILKPLDLISDYRLEMSCKINQIKMSDFWKKSITQEVNNSLKDHEEKYVINLASLEYSSSLDQNSLIYPLININFKIYKDNKYQTIGIFAKKARGLMLNYIISNKITKLEEIKGFNLENYRFNKEKSDKTNLVFLKE